MSKKQPITDLLKECSEVADCVMDCVENVLTAHDMAFSKNGESEIIVEGETKDDIKTLLLEIDEVTEEQIKVLISITESAGKVFIRQTMK